MVSGQSLALSRSHVEEALSEGAEKATGLREIARHREMMGNAYLCVCDYILECRFGDIFEIQCEYIYIYNRVL